MEENQEVRKRIAQESYWNWMKKHLEAQLDLQNKRTLTAEQIIEMYAKRIQQKRTKS